MDIFEDKTLVKMCAPMVRYSRLPFRLLVRDYGCDVAFTPMLMSESFVKSERYREIEYSTCRGEISWTEDTTVVTHSWKDHLSKSPGYLGYVEDSPLIVQFAASNPTEFANAAELAYRDCIGVDLNCGCPQSWATKEGIGACLMNRPEAIADILSQTRNRISDSKFSISVKIRIFLDLQRTVDLARQLEATGISFLTVHGRTKSERAEPVHLDYIKAIVDSVNIPVIANGDIDSLEKAYSVQEFTGAKGVMSARSIIENPALYAGHEKTPVECIKKWIDINQRLDTHFTMFHRHLIHMCSPILTKSERRVFNNLNNREDILEYLQNKFGLL